MHHFERADQVTAEEAGLPAIIAPAENPAYGVPAATASRTVSAWSWRPGVVARRRAAGDDDATGALERGRVHRGVGTDHHRPDLHTVGRQGRVAGQELLEHALALDHHHHQRAARAATSSRKPSSRSGVGQDSGPPPTR